MLVTLSVVPSTRTDADEWPPRAHADAATVAATTSARPARAASARHPDLFICSPFVSPGDEAVRRRPSMTGETRSGRGRLVENRHACEALGPERARDVALDAVPEGDLLLGAHERHAREHLEHALVRLAVQLLAPRPRGLGGAALDEREERGV